ncbi:hypothetical protein AKJ39_03505 [candidate division MSBL1 archaeon SCGC-AAA259J03]|uniref:ArnR1-like winged helix-turn-helix domain-containing protein n=1 Tax=candidate division MSBL1 archaeon SCGC-AAA259J03 TaxID=1698269 RepID=A0A656YVL9_9EURY|nr:hypothetical protein AKJ39_03505 [candidate division MSBL1 archaeon SCGC-AAA259J03]
MRIGRIERLILVNLLEMEENVPENPYQIDYSAKYTRRYWGERIPTLGIRNRIYGRDVGPSERASFSRALRRLEEKGLIRAWNHAGWGEKDYRTHVKLTEEGKKIAKAKR